MKLPPPFSALSLKPRNIPGRCWTITSLFFLVSVSLCSAASVTKPSKAASDAAKGKGYLIVALGRGHLNRLCLTATLEGTKGLMMLDTGAAGSDMSDDKYRFLLPHGDHKLPPSVPRSARVNGHFAYLASSKDFYINGVNLGSLVFPLVAREQLLDRMIKERQYDGLLGEDLLRHYRAVVDCGRLALYLMTNPAMKLDLGPGLVKAGWTRVPMTNMRHLFVVPCKINGQTFRMIVDTGAPFVSMDRRMLLGAHVEGRKIAMQGGVIEGGASQMEYVSMPTMELGGFTATNTQVVVDPASVRLFQDEANDARSGKVLGFLGGSFLANHHAIIDIGGSALYLK